MKLESKIDRIANSIVTAGNEYQYVHDPEHRNKPHGEFYETEAGWSNDPKDNAYNSIYSKYSLGPLSNEQRASYPSITIDRGSSLSHIRSTFIGGKDTAVSKSEAHQINKASNLFLAYAQSNEARHDEGEEVQTYVEDEIPRAIRRGDVNNIGDQTYSFHPSEDIIHNIKFIEFLDKINPKLTEKLLNSSYIAPHEQTPESIELADRIHQIANGALSYKPRFG